MAESLIDFASKSHDLDAYLSAAEIVRVFCVDPSPEQVFMPGEAENQYNTDPRLVLARRMRGLARSLVVLAAVGTSHKTDKDPRKQDPRKIAAWPLPSIRADGRMLSRGGELALFGDVDTPGALVVSVVAHVVGGKTALRNWSLIPDDPVLGTLLATEPWDEPGVADLRSGEILPKSGLLKYHSPFTDTAEVAPYRQATNDIVRLAYAASTGVQLPENSAAA